MSILRALLIAIATFAFMAVVDTSAATAKSHCGGANEVPCKVWERVLSCDSGLVEKGGLCVRPAGGKCGALRQRPCLVTERIPSCDANLVEKVGSCVKPAGGTCGALGQRPCSITERIPSCNVGLVEYVGQKNCVRQEDFKKALKAALPPLAELKKPDKHAKVQVTFSNDPELKAKALGLLDARAASSQTAENSTDAAMCRDAKRDGVILMRGVDINVSVVIIGGGREDQFGPVRELGRACSASGQATSYSFRSISIGPQAGMYEAMVWTRANPKAAGLDYWAAEFAGEGTALQAVSLDLFAFVGGKIQVLFDKNWKMAGVRGGPGVGLDMGLYLALVDLYTPLGK